MRQRGLCVCVSVCAGRESWDEESSLTASKVNVPAVEDWKTREKVTMEERQDREAAVSLSEDTSSVCRLVWITKYSTENKRLTDPKLERKKKEFHI